MNRLNIAAPLILLTLAGCAGAGGGTRAVAPASSGQASATTTGAQASTSAPPLQVSTATTCRLLFEGVDRPLVKSGDQITAFVKDPTMKHNKVDDLRAIADELQSIQARASDETAPYIQPAIDIMRQMADVKERGENAQLNFDDYKAAGLELSQFCS
jgi:hypothetical protein